MTASAKRPGTAAAAAAATGWQVQVGSFDSREHADRLAHVLKLKGFGVSVTESMSHGRRWYRVRVGPERDRTAALAVARRLHAAGQAAVLQRP
jgi:DedD protein